MLSVKVSLLSWTEVTAFQGSVWKNLMVLGSGEMRSPGHPIDFQASPSPR